MRTTQIKSPAGVIHYPNGIAFMYSRQPVIIECGAGASYNTTVKVTCETNGGASYTETRRMLNGRAEFDISRIMQTLARDVDGVLQRVDYENGSALAEVFSLEVTIGNTKVLTLQNEIQALYGALDAGEVYGQKTTRRLFMNYPQTFNIWKDAFGSFQTTFAGVTNTPPYSEAAARCREVCPQTFLGAALLTALRNGQSVQGTTSWLYRLQEGVQSTQLTRETTLIPDNSPRGLGVYLRWLNRRGEVSYWRFDKTQLETAGAVSESFRRHYEGDPAAPVDKVFRNEDKRSYEENRRLGITTTGLSEEEFDDLCTLLTSPVVEMLYVAEEYTGLGLVVNGGTAAAVGDGAVDGQDAEANLTGLDGGAARETQLHYSEEDRWVRVNIEGGTQGRRNRQSTPRLHDFEATITLNQRNTARL